MGLRVRWGLVVKGGAVLVAGFVALQLMPQLLKPPAPEPLPVDVGLPRVQVRPLGDRKRRVKRHLGRVAGGGGVPARRRPVFRPTHNLGRPRPQGRKTQPDRDTPSPRQDPPANPIVPAPEAPPPPPEPAPVEPSPPPAPPDDGSTEFAPH